MVLRTICTTYVHIYFLQYWLVNLIMKLVKKNEKRLLRPQNVIKSAAFSNRIPITISITINFKCYFCKCVICSVTCSKISRKHVGITFLSRALMWILGQSLHRSTVSRLWSGSHSLMLSIDAKRWNHREIDYFWTLKKDPLTRGSRQSRSAATLRLRPFLAFDQEQTITPDWLDKAFWPSRQDSSLCRTRILEAVIEVENLLARDEEAA